MKHFTAFKRLLPGIALLIVAAGVLLISDLENRNQTEKSSGIGLLPEPGRTYRIGIGYFAPEEGNDNVVRGIFDGLAELGFHKGENLEAILKHAGGEIGNIPMMFQSLDNENLDVITPLSTPCLMGALTAVKNNPIVFTYCYDPVAAGAGESYENHLPNVTGVGSFPAITETAEFIKLIVPDAKKVGTIYNSSEANSQKAIAVGQEEFKKTGMEIV
ncbi:MAG: ABC transporter substrate binding protein, partial [Bacteroidota bacterium]